MTYTVTRIGERGGIPLTRGKKLYFYAIDISSYETGGVDIQPSVLGLKRVDSVMAVAAEPTQNADHVMHYDSINKKLYGIVASTGAQLGAVDIGIQHIWVIGR